MINIFTRNKRARIKKQIIQQLCFHFTLIDGPVDSAVIDRILIYYLVKLSTTAGDKAVRMKIDSYGQPRIKSYDPLDFSHKKKYQEEFDNLSMLAFDCCPTRVAITESIKESLNTGVMNQIGIRKQIMTRKLDLFELIYKHELTYLYS